MTEYGPTAQRATACRKSYERGYTMTSEKVIRAERFELVDGQGEVRAALTADADGPFLSLYDAAGKLIWQTP